jgi:Fe2+ or Zn2+ uptake regulation protein
MGSKRNTVQRQLVYNAVKEIDKHATAEQVYEYLVSRHPSMSKATVYRNLNLMVEMGELVNIGCFSGSMHFDHNCHDHSHLECEVCKRIFDLEGDFSGINNIINDTGTFETKSYRISLYGICKECKQLE